jgi:hypothetical protein
MLLVVASVMGMAYGAPPSSQGITKGQADTLYAPIGTGVLVTAPSTFPGITQPVRIYRQPGGTFSTDLNPASNKNALGSATVEAGIYYVGPSGVSTNSGQSNSPLTIDAALAKSDVVEVRFLSGEYRRTSASTVVTKSVNLVAVERGVKWTAWNTDLAWTLLSGNIYQTTRSTVQIVADGAAGVVDQFGRKAVYKYMGTTSASITGPGQWATDGATVWVWPADNRVMTGTDTNIRLGINAGGTCLNIQGGINVYAEGIDFEGGGSTTGGGRAMVQVSSTGASAHPTFTAVNCSASYSADNGFGSTGGSWITLVNCVAQLNTDDGFGYHYSATYSAIPTVLEIGCRSFNNGFDYQTTIKSVDDNRNGFTIHDGIDVVRVNCLASGSYGPNFADTGTGSSSWNVNCTSRAARGPTRGYGFHALDSASVNTDSCTSLQNLLGQFRAEGSATITDSNSVAFGTNLWDNSSGAGTITASVVAPISMRGSFDDQQRVLPIAVETSVAQSYTLNGGTRQITATGGSLVVVSGSTTSTTVLLPANPVLNQRFAIVNPATVAWTLSGNGFNIDGASTQTMTAGIGRTLVWTGTEWRSPVVTRTQMLAADNTYTGVTTLSGPTVIGIQTFTQSASWTGTVSATTGGSFVLVTGSGASGTLTLPSAPTTGWIVAITTANGASSYTLTAGGTTQIGTATTVNVLANCSAFLQFDGTRYQQIGMGGIVGTGSNSSVTLNGLLSIQGAERRKTQAFASANTIVATAGVYIEKTGAGAYTLALPTGPSVGDTFYFYDVQGDAGTSNLSISSSDKAINGVAAGGGSVVILNKNNGSGMVRYASTGKWIATAF